MKAGEALDVAAGPDDSSALLGPFEPKMQLA